MPSTATLLFLLPCAIQSFLLKPPSTGLRPTVAFRDWNAEKSSRRSSLSAAAPLREADRSFRLGIESEKTGLFRAAYAAFLNSATLYQCFLDHDKDDLPNPFAHVTTYEPTGPDGCESVLAYACVRLAHLSHDALGDSKASTRLYEEASLIDPKPSSVSFDGIGSSMEASYPARLSEAIESYREARRLSPNNGSVLFHLAVALERLGEIEEANSIMETLRRGESDQACLVDSWGYVRWHTRNIPTKELNLYRGTRAMLQIGLEAASHLIHKQSGLVCEFGVASGRSIRMTQDMLPLNVPIHGFDTFTGLPIAWGNEPVGTYSTGGTIPDIQGLVTFHKGLFTDTIPVFLAGEGGGEGPLAFANIDCDLYSSTCDILEALQARVVPGTVIVFDEYLCHPTWRQDEFRAWRECCKKFGWTYEYLGFSLSTKQAIVRVTST